ncbi:MAG: phosphate-starvation-inducible PsiE family protein [Hyphomicrobiales bacterium]|nr:phosphate-starvation-inducible PsiE family protein [Hyphomicrobiales bacterium]
MSPVGTQAKYWNLLSDRLTPTIIKGLCTVLIGVLALWMGAGIARMVLDLGGLLDGSWARLAEHTIVNALIMLALLEVIRTLQAYLKLGRVRVTFILDTALVVLIGELMGLWFKEYEPDKVLLGMAAIALLIGLRFLTAKLSPNSEHGNGAA